MKTLSLLMCLAGFAGAQTYTIPAGSQCRTIESCTLWNLTAPGPLYGFLETGYPYTQFQYQQSPTDNPGYKAQYCVNFPNGGWQVTPTPDAGPTASHFVLTCGTDPLGTSADGPLTMTIDVQAHSVSYYVRMNRWRVLVTVWIVDAGSLTLQ